MAVKGSNRLKMSPLKGNLIAAATLLFCMSASGQYGIGNASMMLNDLERGNRKVTFEAYYPVQLSEGELTQGEKGIEKYPVICFAHGYQHPGDGYGNLTGILVPDGYIMLSLTTSDGLIPITQKVC